MTKFFEVTEAIENGELDEYLHDLSSALKKRSDLIREAQADINRAAITVGSRVKLTGIKPRYMDGEWATVVKVNQTRAVVNLDNERGKWRGDITVPLSCLVSLDRQKEALA
jgi:hypothetical protein